MNQWEYVDPIPSPHESARLERMWLKPVGHVQILAGREKVANYHAHAAIKYHDHSHELAYNLHIRAMLADLDNPEPKEPSDWPCLLDHSPLHD